MKKTPDNPILTVVKAAQPVNHKGDVDKWADRQVGDFCIIDGCIWFLRDGRDNKSGVINKIPTPLTHNFIALIVEQITLDDGAKQETAFLLEGKQKNGRLLPTLTIQATQYQAMQWPLRHYGARGIVEANQATPRRLANAILILSGDIPITTVYRHTGWRKIDEQWCYLSGSGAIGAEGLNPHIRVDMGVGHMRRYKLPAPTDNPGQIAGALFDLLTVAPNNPAVGVSLFCCVIQAVLCECLSADFSLILFGQTGSKKSTCATLAQVCFGDFGVQKNTFPANFTDTENLLEVKGHRAKDVVFVVDDFAPSVSQVETNKLHAKVDKLLRGTGNQAGRGRCESDMSEKPEYYPRGMVIITAEERPKVASVLARSVIVEIKEGDTVNSYLDLLQNQARKGEFSACMSAFIKWLAPRLDDLKLSLPDTIRDIRYQYNQENPKTGHARIADIYASLLAVANIYIDFAQEVGAINSIRAGKLTNDISDTLKGVVRAQSQFQTQSDEVERFISLLRSCFGTGDCHVSDQFNQGPPLQNPHAWGWRSPFNDADLAALGTPVGWINQVKNELWLEPEAVHKVIQKFASAQNDPMFMQKSTLWQRLLDRGVVIAHENDKKSGGKRADVKRVVAGKRTRVLVFSTTLITDCGDG